MAYPRPITTPVPIANCDTHGLHGARSRCFICDTTVEQVQMVEATPLTDAAQDLLDALRYLARCTWGTDDVERLTRVTSGTVGAKVAAALAKAEGRA